MSAVAIGSLFSGIGGLELGLERSIPGAHVAWQCEIDPFCRAVLAKHWPGVTRYEDVRALGTSTPVVDILCGGFPCQDVSSAGIRRGLSGERSGLWYEYLRVVSALRPRFVVVENVASGKSLWLPQVKEGLQALGYGTRAYALSASDVGAPHLRRRVFVVATNPARYSNGEGKSTKPIHGEVAELRGVASGASTWATPPLFRGVGDGIPGRLDRSRRLKMLGNAVVPQCAEVIGRIISGLL